MKDKYLFSEEEKQIINGLLLSDACLTKGNYLSINTSSNDFINYIYNSLPKYIWTNTGIRIKNIYDKRSNKTFIMYRLQTHTNLYFKELRNKWYLNNKKVIPNDILITNKTLLFWYLGDGCVLQNHIKKRTYSIKLCTNSFNDIDVKNILIPQLNKYTARLMYVEKNNPVIIIPRYKCDEFLLDIGNCPFNDYLHKWKLYSYKNKNIELYGEVKTNKETILNIIKQYNNGIKITQISKNLNLASSLIIYYLKKENIYIEKRDKQKYEIINGEIKIITDNLLKTCKEYNFCYNNLVSLCSGKIKKYKNLKIRKI